MLIEVRHASRYFPQGNVKAIDGVDLAIGDGEYVAVVGKSGSGKTTLLNLIGGLDRPTEGDIVINDQPIRTSADLDLHRQRRVGFVFQNYYLLPNLTAVENVQIPMFASKLSSQQRCERAANLLRQVGLEGREDHLPSELSGGECQRVAIARSLANTPKLILADEPTGALDTDSGQTVLDLLESLNRDKGITLVVVTHDKLLAQRADRIIRLKDGRIESQSSTQAPSRKK